MSPTGSTRTIGAVPISTGIAAVSQDGARVTTTYDASTTVQRTTLKFWNTKTRSSNQLTLGGDWKSHYIAGGGILTVDGARGLAYKRNAAGKALQRLFIKPGATDSMINPAGTLWVLAYGNRLQVRSATTGELLQTMIGPGQSCSLIAENPVYAVQAACFNNAGLWAREYLINYQGQNPLVPLAPAGYSGVTQTNPRLATSPVRSESGRIKIVTANRATNLPGPALTGVAIGGYNKTAWVIGTPNGTSDGLYKLDLATGARTLLAGGAKGGVVTAAQVIDGHH